jgi:hypothetical protein
MVAGDGWLARYDDSLRRIEVATGRVQFTSRHHFGYEYLKKLQMGPGGRWLAGAFSNGHIRIYESGTGRVQATLEGCAVTGAEHAMAVAPDGRWLAAPAQEGKVRVWDPATGTALATLSADPGGDINAVAASPDGAWLATVRSGTVRIWETATWQPHAMTRLERRVGACLWLGNSALAVEAGGGMTVLNFHAGAKPAAFAGPDSAAQADATASGFVLGKREGALAAMKVPIGLIAAGLIVAAASIPVARLRLSIPRSVQSDIISAGGVIGLVASAAVLFGTFYLLRRRRIWQAERVKLGQAIFIGITFWTGLILILVSDATLHAILVAGLGGYLICFGIAHIGYRFEGAADLGIALLIVPFGLFFAWAAVRTIMSHGSAQDWIDDLVIAATVFMFAARVISG